MLNLPYQTKSKKIYLFLSLLLALFWFFINNLGINYLWSIINVVFINIVFIFVTGRIFLLLFCHCFMIYLCSYLLDSFIQFLNLLFYCFNIIFFAVFFFFIYLFL